MHEVDHGPVVDRQQVLVGDAGEGVKPRAGAPGQDDALHRRKPTVKCPRPPPEQLEAPLGRASRRASGPPDSAAQPRARWPSPEPAPKSVVGARGAGSPRLLSRGARLHLALWPKTRRCSTGPGGRCLRPDDQRLLRQGRAGRAAVAVLPGGVHAEHRSNVTSWWIEVFGGPADYTKRLGGYERMLNKHRELGVTPEQRFRFASLMSLAADDAGMPSDPEFRSALVAYLEWGTRLALENSHLAPPSWSMRPCPGGAGGKPRPISRSRGEISRSRGEISRSRGEISRSRGRAASGCGSGLGQDGVGQLRPCLSRPRPEGAVGQSGAGQPGDWVDPDERTRLAEVAKGRRRVVDARSSGVLGPLISTPSPQSQGSNLPKPGRTPANPGKATDVASSWVAALMRVGAASSAARPRRSQSGPASPEAGEPPLEPDGAGQAQRAEHPVGDVRRKRPSPSARPATRPAIRNRHWNRSSGSRAHRGANGSRARGPRHGPAGVGPSTRAARPARRGPWCPPPPPPARPGPRPAWSPTPRHTVGPGRPRRGRAGRFADPGGSLARRVRGREVLRPRCAGSWHSIEGSSARS